MVFFFSLFLLFSSFEGGDGGDRCEEVGNSEKNLQSEGEELRYSTQDHNHAHGEVDKSAAMRKKKKK